MQWEFYKNTEDTWEAMKDALRQAERSIYLESYVFVDDEIGHAFVDILVERAQAGLDVKVVLDGIGSFWFSVSALRRLQAAGAKVLSFQSLAFKRIFKSFRRLFHRNHRKVLIIDRRVGFIGGVNVRKDFGHWLDVHVKIVGEDWVAPLVRSFAKIWLHGGGVRHHVKTLLRHPIRRAKEQARHIKFVFTHPYRRFKEHSAIRRVYLNAMRQAKQRVVIATPYFLPDKKLMAAMEKAIARGVTIDVITPLFSDIALITYAIHARIPTFHHMGITLHLLGRMMHGKALVVDGNFGMVGSSNIDPRSFFYNHEADLSFTKKKMVSDLDGILRSWKKEAKLFDPQEWKARPIRNQILEQIGEWMSPIL